jgi:hypothetical protein
MRLRDYCKKTQKWLACYRHLRWDVATPVGNAQGRRKEVARSVLFGPNLSLVRRYYPAPGSQPQYPKFRRIATVLHPPTLCPIAQRPTLGSA